jgi:Holliday junction resolvase RusA-like endonuclease
MPKENASARIGKDGRPIVSLHNRDYRTRKIGTHPKTGKPIVQHYDSGYMARWQQIVRTQVWEQMKKIGADPYPQGWPVAVGILIFRTKAESNETDFPVGTPDKDNFEESIMNALKRPAPQSKKLVAIRNIWPNGVLFHDDSQATLGLIPQGKIWATPQHPPGALISVQTATEVEYIQPFTGKIFMQLNRTVQP